MTNDSRLLFRVIRPHFFLAISILMCVPVCSQGQTRPADPPTTGPAEQAAHDHFIGWYRLPPRNQRMEVVDRGPATFVPVFKRNGIYYSVCRFVEVPMKAVPDGLEWDIKPSSMEGTKITYDPRKKEYALTIHDSREQSDWPASGILQPMRKVDTPFALPDCTAKPPKTNDDFVGWYEAVWMPPLRYHIKKEGDKFLADGQLVGRDEWREPAVELQPLSSSLGFAMGSRGKTQIIYNQQLQRYEIPAGPGAVIPLKRSDSEPSKDFPKLSDKGRIGIPSW